MAVDVPTSDDLPLLPPDAAPARPTIAGQQLQHAADQPPPTDDSLPIAPTEKKSILGTSFGPWEQFSHGLGLGTRNVIEGLTALPGQALDAATYLTGGRALGDWISGKPVTKPSEIPMAVLDKTANMAGLPSFPTPQTPGEQARAEFVRGGASMLTPMWLGAAAPNIVAKAPAMIRPFISMDPQSPAKAAQAVIAGGTGGVVGEKVADSDLVPGWAKPTVRMLGNVAGNVGVNTLAGAGTTLYNAAKGNITDLAAALERLGITPRTMGAVSERPGVQGTEALESRLPLASDVLQPKQQQMVGDFGSAIEKTAKLAETSTDPALRGTATTAQNTGGAVQGYIRNWLEKILPDREAGFWNPVNDTMRPKGEVVIPSGLRTALENTASDSRLASLPELQQSLARTQIQKWLADLNKGAAPGTNTAAGATAKRALAEGDVPTFLKAITNPDAKPPGQITWDASHAIQQNIGDAMGTPALVDSLGDKALKAIYAGIAEDRRQAAILHGVGDQFQAANEFSTSANTFKNTTLSKAINTKNPRLEEIAPGDATNNLLNGTGLDHQLLRQNIPEAADLLAAYHLRQMSQARPGQQGAGPTTSVGTFLTNLRGDQLSNPEGTAALFADSDVAKNVRDLGTVAGQFKDVQRNMNTSNTAAGLQIASAASSLAAGLATGDMKLVGAALSILGGPYVAAKVLTNPGAIALSKARPASPPAVPGLLGGAISSQAAGGVPRYNFSVSP